MNGRSKITLCRCEGFAIPATLFVVLLLAFVVSALFRMSRHNMTRIESDRAQDVTYLAAEGAAHKQIADMAVLGPLWSQRTNLAVLPDNYEEYSPSTYASRNGIPTCTGVACHRHMYPVGEGLIKNFGPLDGDGATANSDFVITEQLDPDLPPEPDLTVGGVDGWTQVERLDELMPGAASVGGNLSNAIAEGGNAKAIRYRITGLSLKSLRGKRGYSTVIAVIEMPIS